MKLEIRKQGWSHCHLHVTHIELWRGRTFVEGMIVETKTGITRCEYYRDEYGPEWFKVMTVEDLVEP